MSMIILRQKMSMIIKFKYFVINFKFKYGNDPCKYL